MATRQIKKKQLPPEKLLSGIPYKNREAQVDHDKEGPILWVPFQKRWWLKAPFSWFLPYREKKGFRLDRLGYEVWKACDGNLTIENIIEDFAGHHRVSFHEARVVVMQFIRHLTKRNLVAVVFKES